MKLSHSSLQGNPNDSGVLLLHDDFVDADTTVLSSHIISPVNLYKKLWVKDNTYDLTIVDNKLTSTGLDTVAEKENDHIIDLEVTNVTIEAGIQITAFGTGAIPSLAFLMARYQDSSNHVGVVFQVIDGEPDRAIIEIRELTANQNITLCSCDISASVIFDYMVMKLVDTGDELIAYIDGVEKCRAVYTRLNDQTKIGIKTQSETCTYEYLKVWNT